MYRSGPRLGDSYERELTSVECEGRWSRSLWVTVRLPSLYCDKRPLHGSRAPGTGMKAPLPQLLCFHLCGDSDFCVIVSHSYSLERRVRRSCICKLCAWQSSRRIQRADKGLSAPRAVGSSATLRATLCITKVIVQTPDLVRPLLGLSGNCG